MKRLFFLPLVLCSITAFSQDLPRFAGDQGNGYFLNPILAGEYPDPSILRDGNDYYMTNTSLNNYPGLLIWHSTDLVNWEPVAHALHKSVGEIWAPDLCKFDEKFYIYFPARDARSTMVVTADRITGPWSDPVDLHIGYIDPGHVVGNDGRRYLYFSDGHVVRLSDDGLSTVGEVKTVYEGWKYPNDWLTECFCLESPKLFKRGKYFYLVSAQGGTSGPPTSHMVVAARSRSVMGPWENSPYNPVVHTYDYSEKWWSKGHGTLVDTPDGYWYIVYHAFLNNFRTLGRMTLLEPIEWMPDGWFRIKPGSDPARPIPIPSAKGSKVKPLPERVDGFSPFEWHAYSAFDPDRYLMTAGQLRVTSLGISPIASDPMQFTPGHEAYSVTIRLEPSHQSRAGLLLFYGPQFYRGLELAHDSISYVTEKQSFAVASDGKGKPMFFRILNDHQTLALYYSNDGNHWTAAWDASDISPYTGNLLGNFRSLKIAIYSCGTGETVFSDFHYEPVN